MKRLFVALLSVGLVFSSSGCAMLVRGLSQSVAIKTSPEGGSVRYQGRTVADGETVLISKSFEPPRLHVEGVPVDLRYQPDPWLIGDAALLFLGVIPGVVALSIDFVSGGWRNLDTYQWVPVPESSTAAGPQKPPAGE